MRCSKCNCEIPNGAQFCSSCGAVLESNVSATDDRLMKAYIGGPNANYIYNRVMTDKFNIYAFLFGAFYYIYRKMYLVAFLMMMINFFMILIFDLSGLIVGIIYGVLFFPLYKWDITRKIDKIKKLYNSGNELEIIEKVKAKGGTSKVAAGISAFVYISFYILLIASFFMV